MANPLTLRAIKRLQIIPIVTRRSIPDSLISLRHEIERQWISLLENINKRGFITTFFGAVSSRTVNKFLNSPFEYKMDFLIDVCSPWYFLFLESWENAAEKGLDVYFVEYENIMTDAVKELGRILTYLNYTVDMDKLRDFIDSVKQDDRNRINLRTGKKGAGKQELTAYQMDRIRRIGANFGYDLGRFAE